MERFLRSLMVAIFATITFAAGSVRALALPAGYTQVEYLEGDGASYIDTGVFANLNTKAEIKYKPMQSMLNMAMFGARTSKSSNAFTVWASNSNGKVSCNISSKGAIASTVDLVANQDYVVSLSSSALVVKGTTKSISGATDFTTPSSMYIFNIGGTPASSSGSGNRIFIGRVYYFKVYDNNVLTHDFVPVKYVSNGTTTYGMYDLMDSNPATAFRTNQGTGTFTAGPMACLNGGTLQTYTTVVAADVPAGVQNGTPTPTNPITPTFYTQGNMVLRKVGDYADSYDATTGKITRRVGVKVLDGTEDWEKGTSFYTHSPTLVEDALKATHTVFCTHYQGIYTNASGVGDSNNCKIGSNTAYWGRIYIYADRSLYATGQDFANYLAQQYANGTPVTVYYPLTESNYYTEDWAEESYCRPSIKIATRAYNTTQFAPVVSALNTAVDTIKNVVTNTINQTAAVSALQSTKQTRPDEECPAGKKCLLVEDVDGNPHWYEIIDCSADNVLAGMRFVEENVAFGPGEMWGVRTSQGSNSLMCSNDAIACQNGEWVTSYDTSLTTNIGNEIVFGIARNVSITERTRGSIVRLPNDVPTGNVCVCKATRYQLWDSGTSAYGADHNIDTDSWFVAGIETSNGNDCLNLCGDDRTNGISKEAYFQYISNACNANVAVANSYLPAGYIPLEYIRSNGVAYIDTGYSPTSKTRIELVAKVDSGAGNINIVGSAISSSSGSSTGALLVINSYTDTEYEVKFGAAGNWPKGATNMTTKNTFSLSATEFRVNDVVKETYSGSVPDTGNKPFYLFQRWRPEITGTSSKVQIYEFNIYENGTLVRRMVPAKNSSGVIGMYDLADPNPATAFHTNAGTGTFTAGPEI